MNARQEFTALAVSLSLGELNSPERRQATCLAAGKSEQQLQLTVAKLIARRAAYEGLQGLVAEHQEAQRCLAIIEAKGTNVTPSERVLHDRFRRAAAMMAPGYDAGRAFLYESADLQLREDAVFAAGRLDSIRTLRETLASLGRSELAEEAASIEKRLVGEHQAKLTLVFEWQNVEHF